MQLIEKLTVIQKTERWSDRQMANQLGISQQMWQFVRTGRHVPGRKTLTGIMRAYPELTADVLLYLQADRRSE